MLRKRLERYGISENKRRGKGSHRMFEGVVDGKIVRYPTKCHSENEEKLTADRGVSDEDFYG